MRQADGPSIVAFELTKTVSEDIIFKNTVAKLTGKWQEETKMVFENIEEGTTFTIQKIEEFLDDMFVTPDQFVVLTAPKAQGQQIRYVQACINDGEDDVHTEIAVEEEDGTHLYYRMCTDEECVQIFMDFFDRKLVVDKGEYKPVSFKEG